MCNIKQGFKLCTCSDVDTEGTHWKLLRFVDSTPSIVVGRPNFAYFEKLDDYRFIDDELNARNCFDFDFQPRSHDRLIFRIKKGGELLTLCYDYQEGSFKNGWTILDLYDHQGVSVVQKGKVE